MERQSGKRNESLFQEDHKMFSDNKKISPRQVRRALSLEMIGISTLLLPGYLAKNSGIAGVAAILFGASGALGLLCLWNCLWAQGEMGEADHKRKQNPLPEKILKMAGGISLTVLSAYILFVLTSMIRDQLLDGKNEEVILLTLTGAGIFGLWKGLEARVRIYEVLFWLLLIPLIIILILACVSVTPAYWCLTEGSVWGFVKSCYVSFLFFSISSLFLFFRPQCNPPGKAIRSAREAMALVIALNVVIYLILLGIFQQKLLSIIDYPVILLMAVVKLPGEFFERQDALMVGIWFFCLFALFHSLLFYGKELLRSSVKNANSSGIIQIVWSFICGGIAFFIAWMMLRFSQLAEAMAGVIIGILAPVLLVLPLLLYGLNKRKSNSSGARK